MHEIAKTLKQHWNSIVNFMDSNITNGILEGLNTSIQNLKRNAKEYHNRDYFMTVIYLSFGNMKFEVST